MDSSAGGRPPTHPDRASGPRWFAGRFELREELGRGAFAVVHRAWDASRQAEVALKVLHRVEPRAAERFRREAEVLGRLRHPNIVAALESGAADGQPFIVEELVRGPTLSAIARTRPAPGKAAQLARGIAAAVAHAHAAGVVHRDLKPDNVVVDAAGRPRVLDFGIAGLLGAEGPALTMPGAPLGTPGYMAPEQVRGSATPASDVYAVGGVLYELLCGKAPFDGASDPLFATLEAPPPRPSDVAPQVPPALDEVVLRCLAKDPGDRFPDADALRDALDAFLEGAIATEPARRPAPPRAVVGLVVVGLVVVGLALALGLGGLAQRAATPRAEDAASPVNDDPADDPAARLTALAAAAAPDAAALLALRREAAADPRVAAAAAEASGALRARAWALAHEGGPYRPEVLDLLRLAGDLVADDPDACARARLEEADYLHRRAHHEEALARARAAPARGRLMREQALHVAQNLRGLGRGEESVPVLEALVAADAEDVPGLVAAASLRAASWDYPASHALAERALALDPDSRPALTILGVGLAFRRGEARALEVVARAKALAPDDAHLDCVAGWAHMHQRQTDAAVAAFARAQALTAPRPFHKAIKWRGIVLHRGGRDREALDELDEAVRLRPREADTLMYRGAALFRTGERARALSDWRAAHALDPDFFRRRLNDLPPDLRKAMTDATRGG